MRRLVVSLGLLALGACAERINPTYTHEATHEALHPGAAPPGAIRADFERTAAAVCGGGAEILAQRHVGYDGPFHSEILFACD